MPKVQTIQIFEKPLTRKEIQALHHLADGIECGATLLRKGTQTTFTLSDSGRPIATCALGAAHHCYLVMNDSVPKTLTDWIELKKTEYEDILRLYGVEPLMVGEGQKITLTGQPGAKYADMSYEWGDVLTGIIWTLNDYLNWSREAIAAWLRTLR